MADGGCLPVYGREVNDLATGDKIYEILSFVMDYVFWCMIEFFFCNLMCLDFTAFSNQCCPLAGLLIQFG